MRTFACKSALLHRSVVSTIRNNKGPTHFLCHEVSRLRRIRSGRFNVLFSEAKPARSNPRRQTRMYCQYIFKSITSCRQLETIHSFLVLDMSPEALSSIGQPTSILRRPARTVTTRPLLRRSSIPSPEREADTSGLKHFKTTISIPCQTKLFEQVPSQTREARILMWLRPLEP